MKKYPGFHRAAAQHYETSTVVASGHRICTRCFKRKPVAAFERGYLCKACSPRARRRARTLKEAAVWGEQEEKRIHHRGTEDTEKKGAEHGNQVG